VTGLPRAPRAALPQSNARISEGYARPERWVSYCWGGGLLWPLPRGTSTLKMPDRSRPQHKSVRSLDLLPTYNARNVYAGSSVISLVALLRYALSPLRLSGALRSTDGSAPRSAAYRSTRHIRRSVSNRCWMKVGGDVTKKAGSIGEAAVIAAGVTEGGALQESVNFRCKKAVFGPKEVQIFVDLIDETGSLPS
jgi:hypothetical protein